MGELWTNLSCLQKRQKFKYILKYSQSILQFHCIWIHNFAVKNLNELYVQPAKESFSLHKSFVCCSHLSGARIWKSTVELKLWKTTMCSVFISVELRVVYFISLYKLFSALHTKTTPLFLLFCYENNQNISLFSRASIRYLLLEFTREYVKLSFASDRWNKFFQVGLKCFVNKETFKFDG